MERSQAHEHYTDNSIDNFTNLCICGRTDFPNVLAVTWTCLFFLLMDEWDEASPGFSNRKLSETSVWALFQIQLTPHVTIVLWDFNWYITFIACSVLCFTIKIHKPRTHYYPQSGSGHAPSFLPLAQNAPDSLAFIPAAHSQVRDTS